MEPLNSASYIPDTLVLKVRRLIQLADGLIALFDAMVRECNSNSELNDYRQWIVDAKANIQRYRYTLVRAATDRDVALLPGAAASLADSYKYISDAGPLCSMYSEEMIQFAKDLSDTGNGIYVMINRFDPANVEAVKTELKGFTVEGKP